MKRILILALLFVVLSAAFLTSCGEIVTPVAYTRFDTSEDLEVFYTSHMSIDQIMAYKDDDLVFDFTFTRCLGADDMEGKRYTLVDVSYKPYLSVAVYYRYSPEKHFYLNGEVLVPYDVYVDSIDDSCAVYFFRDLDLVRTNPGGMLYPDKVNYIEYK